MVFTLLCAIKIFTSLIVLVNFYSFPPLAHIQHRDLNLQHFGVAQFNASFSHMRFVISCACFGIIIAVELGHAERDFVSMSC